MVKTNRNMWVLILLSLVTCGIYPLFYWAGVGEDVNKMCAADGKTTQNFWIAWLLGLITPAPAASTRPPASARMTTRPASATAWRPNAPARPISFGRWSVPCCAAWVRSSRSISM